MKKYKIIFGLLVLILVLSACNSNENEGFSFEEVKNNQIDHIHGLGYINGESDVVIATHFGLYKYAKDGWKEANSQKHDYMGFQAVREGFFSSGHPEEGSEYKNPLGLIKSIDKGASFEQLAFYGEIDFHYLTAGYDSNTIYVLNEMPVEEMNAGLHYSTDEGSSWTKAAMNGFTSDYISNLSAHPTRKELLTIGSKDGIFISNDHGQNFKSMNDTKMVTYVTLTETGGYYSNLENDTVYLKFFLFESDEEINIQLPKELKMDPITFIAVNPENQQEIVIVTNSNNIYITKDEGLSWDQIASNGELAK
ncbi:F510_1955 family glycosylhydrolase [Psychrobacillus sp. BL-248-WT-3]|uniref:F510_1955 family glycosylhydrolase n=1 Tax=Psychrobacillus sp. BL-248-WT-3 TaxID=2725306 RepID=UPI00146CD063|nr:sialidase [Psychrobacillus sp. BL-248-WT-3]NME06886.1 sialidase [Psychrobacillus sp. BL-248-WT-3]